ncbi:hypothetical protein PG997_008650 [Apiospora hydei]|uniref:Uncharacterized protein n=1 Tax=Apiospora hydei TaxID=1337664 RepID=A0ABR1WBN3_9PEZI
MPLRKPTNDSLQLQRRGVRELPVALVHKETLSLRGLLRGFPIVVSSSIITSGIWLDIRRAINGIFVILVLDAAIPFLRVLIGASTTTATTTTTNASKGRQLEGPEVVACHDAQHLVNGVLQATRELDVPVATIDFVDDDKDGPGRTALLVIPGM